MNDTLLAAVRRYTETYADPTGVARPPVRGMSLIRAARPSGIDYAISRPVVCLVLQGSKRVAMGTQMLSFSAGDSLLITSDVPTVSQITHASASEPYLSLILDLDLSAIAELAMEMKLTPTPQNAHVQVEPSDEEVADAALRLLRLVERPAALPVLQPQAWREIHYWLLVGKHGPIIRQLGWPEGHAQRIARAVATLRAEFTRPIPMERLADIAGMSLSSFYKRFRLATSLSPLQFQKQLRLIEARRLMISEAMSASSAAFAVGYESVQQFTREYKRMFGLPPQQDADLTRNVVGN
ncbi:MULTISPECIES: AraC family transcriptional regulator [Pandoraea]|uniref:AraC family transcriptional regulator n=1 Tax=Pandoraea TaxID=93217 RepID=UPI001F5DCF23|nr:MULTISPECIES: AraC family transcriptional regulator [Pandoraea]MCI3208701.1 AraC family transcriptional regulator [Pandoraea sp. LA3]MDN4586730.1 AraC family transcriptional regulator [Pandoraea capi]